MPVPKDWEKYSTLDEAARAYLRDPEMALDQLRSLVDFSAVTSFIMSRGASEDCLGRGRLAGGPAHRRSSPHHVARRRRAVDRGGA